MEAAERILIERGYAQTTIEDMCAAAGYTRGAFYSSFGSKQDLVLALFDRYSAHRLDQLEGLLDDAAPGTAHRIARAFLEVDPADRSWILLFLEFRLDAARNAKLSAQLHEHDRAVAASLAQLLERAQAVEPGAGAVSFHSLASVLLAAREGVLARTASEGPGGQETLTAAVDVFAEVLPALFPALDGAR
ncbi:TetR/AcrR family transcriptional regulator [Streptomyces sp. NPDC020742]|uniref:TetR/AcrR family transcriptional regulator n=1 Tax=unclassified Streptomyces TaxID=2593676 RepID=UPI0033C003FF